MDEAPEAFQRLVENERGDLKRIHADLIKQVKYLRRPLGFAEFLQNFSGSADMLSRFLFGQSKLKYSSFDYSMSRAANRGKELYNLINKYDLEEDSVAAVSGVNYEDALQELPSHIFDEELLRRESNPQLQSGLRRARDLLDEISIERIIETVQNFGFGIVLVISDLLQASGTMYDEALRQKYDLYVTDGGDNLSFEFIVVMSLWGVGALSAIAWDGTVGNFGSIPIVLMTGSAFYVAARNADWKFDRTV